MENSVFFKNLNLTKIVSHKTLNVIALTGFRSVILINSQMRELSRYLDANVEERFCCCEFMDVEDVDKNACGNFKFINLLVLAGESGIIKIIDIKTGKLISILKGHTGRINCIKTVDDFIFSCSEDSSIRVWNIKNGKCIGLLAGILGHKDSINSIDILYNKEKLVSAGTDYTIKQWSIKEILNPINKDKFIEYVGFPLNNFQNIHKKPITKIEYYGNLIVSLSNNEITVIYNNSIDMNAIDNGLKGEFGESLNELLIGKINMYENCKTFKIVNHTLIGISETGDIYLFDLRDISRESTPLIVKSNIKGCTDFIIVENELFSTNGNKIEKISLDLSILF
ncbi:Protein with WD40 repeat protein [Nucleospora cyclopteri]